MTLRLHRPLILVLLLAAFAAPAHAQGFHALYSRDGIDVWAVGDAGAVWRSFDSGTKWTARPSLGTKPLRGIAARGLAAIAVGDSGRVYRSTNSGGTWTLAVIAGAPELRGIEWPADDAAFAVGGNGGIWKSTDGGANWSPQVSGTAQKLNAIRFRDALNGWAVGGNGVALKTVNGGAGWSPTTTGTTKELRSIDFVGSTAWAVGAFGTALKTTNSGGLWTSVDLKLDSQGDVTAVWLDPSGTTVTMTGGGGFLRSSSNGGTSWTWAIHPLIAPSSDFYQVGSKAWLSSSTQKAVAKTIDGTNWAFSDSVTTAYTWQLKLEGPVVITRGNTFATSPQNRNAAWVVIGQYIFKSLNRGDTWALLDSIPNCVKTNSFYVSPKDSTKWVAAVGTPDRVMRTLNSGASWTTTISKDFSEYGMPVEMHPDKPDTFFFAPEDGRFYRSKDFCATWDTLSIPGFRSPCDLVVVPGDDSKIVVGDGVTGMGFGQIYQSTDGGLNFSMKYIGPSSEVPTVWGNRLENNVVFAANWSNGGVWKSIDYGATWTNSSMVSSAWGGAFANDDPKVTAFNRYAGVPNYLSVDQGQSYAQSSLTTPGSGYALLGLDRSTWLDLHSFGVYKLAVTQTPVSSGAQAVTVTSPNGGETWNAGSVHAVTWNASGIGLARIEYRANPGDPWHLVADVEGYLGTYDWTVPNVPTASAEVRVSDAWDGSPVDASNAVFTILGGNSIVVLTPEAGAAWQYGQSYDVTWQSTGIASVAVEYRANEVGPWQTIADPVAAAAGTTPWVIPNTPTTEARVRVRQVGGPVSATSGLFSIVVPALVTVSPFNFGGVPVNYATWDTVHIGNPGTAPLTITSVTSDNPRFTLSRSALTIPAAEFDTLALWYKPTAVGPDSALITFIADTPQGTHTLRARATGVPTTDADDALPLAFALEPNQPNPFGLRTTIRFALPRASDVRLEVYDLAGRRVAMLVDGARAAGRHAVPFEPGGRLASGVYFVRFSAGGFEATRKMLHFVR